MGSAGGSSSTTYKIPKWQQDIVKPLAQSAVSDYEKAKLIGPYTGQFIADPAAQQREALTSREATIRNLPDLGTSVMNLGLDTAAGKYLNLESNPYFADYITAATDPIRRAQEVTHRAAGTSANAVGAFGGSREAILQGEILRQALAEALNLSGRMAGEAYGQERLLQQNAPQLVSQGLELQMAPSELLFNVGEGLRNFSQDQLNEGLRQYQERFEGMFRPYYPVTDVLGRLGIGAEPPAAFSTQQPTGLYNLLANPQYALTPWRAFQV